MVAATVTMSLPKTGSGYLRSGYLPNKPDTALYNVGKTQVSHDTQALCNLFDWLAWRPCALKITLSPLNVYSKITISSQSRFCGFKSMYKCRLKFE